MSYRTNQFSGNLNTSADAMISREEVSNLFQAYSKDALPKERFGFFENPKDFGSVFPEEEIVLVEDTLCVLNKWDAWGRSAPELRKSVMQKVFFAALQTSRAHTLRAVATLLSSIFDDADIRIPPKVLNALLLIGGPSEYSRAVATILRNVSVTNPVSQKNYKALVGALNLLTFQSDLVTSVSSLVEYYSWNLVAAFLRLGQDVLPGSRSMDLWNFVDTE